MMRAAIGQALVGRANELVFFGIIGQVLRAEDSFADQFGFVVLLLFAMEGIVFDIIAQLVVFNIGIILFAAIASIGRDVLWQAARLVIPLGYSAKSWWRSTRLTVWGTLPGF